MRETLASLEEAPREACGVFGIYAPNQDVAKLTYLGLQALQHRGQEGAGVFVQGRGAIYGVKGLGKAEIALRQGDDLHGLPPSDMATGHVRYGTYNDSEMLTAEERRQWAFRAVQPILGKSERVEGGFTLGHNGHIANFDEVLNDASLTREQCATDSELIVRLIEKELDDTDKEVELRDAAFLAAGKLVGAYSLVIMGGNKLIGIRDPKGFRPLWLGRMPQQGYVLASELAAIDIVGASPEREIEPGEVVQIDEENISSYQPFPSSEIEPRLCLHEFTYFSRPDQVMYGENVEVGRIRGGQRLAELFPVEADIIVPSPNSGRSAAQGYAEASGLPIRAGLVKNEYIDRTFITSGQLSREEKVRIKLNANRAIVENQRVVVVDDSVIRGTTTRVIVAMLREAGAREVHLRIASPPYRHSCFYGMDTPDRDELIAAYRTVEEVCEFLGADSLEYLPLPDLKSALGKAATKLCDACITGNYPTRVPISS